MVVWVCVGGMGAFSLTLLQHSDTRVVIALMRAFTATSLMWCVSCAQECVAQVCMQSLHVSSHAPVFPSGAWLPCPSRHMSSHTTLHAQDLVPVLLWLADQPSVRWLAPRTHSRLFNLRAGAITQVCVHQLDV